VIVTVLVLTIVGTPWAIRQVVRYQFVAHVTVLEDRSGADALRRSSELMRGRWWRTAATVVVLNGTLVIVSVAVAVVALAISGGLPLWVFSGLLSLSVAVLAPFVAIVMTLLYGNAVAESEADAEAETGSNDPLGDQSGDLVNV
ncbi:MAG: glycerophosphoryl diester phosphodiesterase membrane domain-containing protein, partial [Actinomycetota bacterium]